MAKNSTVWLYQGVKLDKGYKHICDNVARTTLAPYLIATQSELSFIRHSLRGGSVKLDIEYGLVLNCNYMVFKNGNSKEFYAFIDDIMYISDKCCEIAFTIDSMTTWYHDWTYQPVNVLREHCTVDGIGFNTQPESVNTGVYVMDSKVEKKFTEMRGALLVAGPADRDDTRIPLPSLINNSLNGLLLIGGDRIHNTDELAELRGLIDDYNEESTVSRIVKLFLYPADFGTLQQIHSDYYQTSLFFPDNTQLDGYIPRNQKLLTFPYKKYVLLSSTGDSMELQPERFGLNGRIKIDGCVLPTPEMKAYPYDYLKVESDYSKAVKGIASVEVPFVGDSYKQWLNQNAEKEIVGVGLNAVGAVLATATSTIAATGVGGPAAGATALAGGAVSGVMSVGSAAFNTFKDFDNAKMNSSSVHGSISTPSLDLAEGYFGFELRVYSIRSEYARIIDHYFDMFGYATNELKVPNHNTRPYFNYVQVAGNIGAGDVPADIMEEINGAFRSGVTIWHDLGDIGDYTVDNSILA